MGSDLLLVVVVIVALGFDFTNGFHDTANAMATSIAEGIVSNQDITLEVILAGLVGAIGWNLLTWLLGLPSSSSHALIGGLVGAAFAAKGAGAVDGEGGLSDVIIPALIAPVLGGAIAPSRRSWSTASRTSPATSMPTEGSASGRSVRRRSCRSPTARTMPRRRWA
jgi:inorganic phosphate transporter, PiT family